MFHFLITDPIDGEHIQTLTAQELDEVYTHAELEQMRNGTAIFKNGSLHVDMLSAARQITMDDLMG